MRVLLAVVLLVVLLAFGSKGGCCGCGGSGTGRVQGPGPAHSPAAPQAQEQHGG
jgi:hypothetical protein